MFLKVLFYRNSHQHRLTATKFGISWVKSKLDQDTPPLENEKMMEAIAMVDETIKSVRRIASKRRPVILDEIGLPAALKWQSRDFEKLTGILYSFTENVIVNRKWASFNRFLGIDWHHFAEYQ